MGRRLAHGFALSLGLALVAACADDDAASPSTFTPSETINETRPPPTVDEPPSGACSDEGAGQIVRTPGWPEACRGKNGGFVPSGPKTWRCACTQSQWRCEVTHGGFSVASCP